MSFDPVHDSVKRNEEHHVLPTGNTSSTSPSKKAAIASLLTDSSDQSPAHNPVRKADISNLLSQDSATATDDDDEKPTPFTATSAMSPPPTKSKHNPLSLRDIVNHDDTTISEINDSTVLNQSMDDSMIGNQSQGPLHMDSSILEHEDEYNEDHPSIKRKYTKKGKSSLILEAMESFRDSSKKDDKEKHYLTLLINSRSRHLKKTDGEPYYRKEIQFQFLMNLFLNRKRVFKNNFTKDPNYSFPSYFKVTIDENGIAHESNGEFLNFFELYVLTLLTSNKLSKILKDRLLLDANYALNFSIACLLVNIGRLNTTVNFDYEMKSQFRTYHSIPSLQVGNHLERIAEYYKIDVKEASDSSHPENEESSSKLKKTGSGYTVSTVKQLQDTPRLKSILKSINDSDENQPRTFKEFIHGIQSNELSLNIVTLIFLFIVYEFEFGKLLFVVSPKDIDTAGSVDSSTNNNNAIDHLENEIDDDFGNKTPESSGSLFNDIWLRILIHPKAKVDRFLWLIYFIQETKLDPKKMIENPFNNPNSKLTLQELQSSIEGTSVADDILANNSTLIHNLRALLPDFRYVRHPKGDASGIVETELTKEEAESIDIDTEEEIRYGEEMKSNRIKYLMDEYHNNGSSPSSSTTAASNSASPLISEALQSSKDNHKQIPTKETAAKKRRTKTNNNNNNAANNNNTNDLMDVDDSFELALTGQNSKNGLKLSKKHKFIDSSANYEIPLQASSSSKELTPNSQGRSLPDLFIAGLLKKKKTKRNTVSSSQTSKVVPLNTQSLSLLLNNDLRYSTSKIAITKKSKNKLFAGLMKQYIVQKTETYRLKRFSFGHVDYFFKNGNLRLGKDLMILQVFELPEYNKYNKNYVPNIFSRRSDSKSAINNITKNETENRSSNNANGGINNGDDPNSSSTSSSVSGPGELDVETRTLTKADLPHLNSKFEDFGEFKINLYKTYTKINNLLYKTLDDGIEESEAGSQYNISTYNPVHSSFIDDLFDQIE